jgi:hypothetical protein
VDNLTLLAGQHQLRHQALESVPVACGGILTRRASFDVALSRFVAPKGQPQISTGQRPGRNASATRPLPCKGKTMPLSPSGASVRPASPRDRHIAVAPRLSRPFRARNYCDFLPIPLNSPRSSERCPGLICLGPFGARSRMRNIKTRKRGSPRVNRGISKPPSLAGRVRIVLRW